MGKKSGRKVDKAFCEGMEYAFDLIEESFKLVQGIGPKKQEQIMIALKKLASQKKEGK